MNLSTFVSIANDKERERLCALADTKFSYIRRLTYGKKKCSPYKAYEIEEATRLIAIDNERLEAVPGVTLATNRKRYQKLVSDIRQRGQRGASAEARVP